MKRPLCWAVAAACLAGCATPPPQMENPFLGRQTVPPPGTAAPTAPPTPYYQPSPQPGAYQPAPQPGAYQQPGGYQPVPQPGMSGSTAPVAPETQQAFHPPADRPKATRLNENEYRSGATAIARPTRIRADESTAGMTAHANPRSTAAGEHDGYGQYDVADAAAAIDDAAVRHASHEAPIRIVESELTDDDAVDHRSQAVVDPWAGEPRAFHSPGDAVDIMSLPPARRSSDELSSQAPKDRHQTTVMTASHQAAQPTATRARGQYGYDPGYASLQGKLEYLASSGQWKLRYIPIDGHTDRYGGSVVLDASPLLEQYAPGDFVSVTGTLAGGPQNSRDFAPVYTIGQMQPQAR